MCGVIGYAGDPDEELIKRLFWETNIRGQHASGISHVGPEDDLIITTHIPGPDSVKAVIREVEHLASSRMVIGHARYSTSSLKYNQPMTGSELSIVHNGVVSQEDPSAWKDRFGYSCETENDSELILRALEAGDHPLTKFPEASMAVVALSRTDIRFFRNGKRPLWYVQREGSVVISSTKDILLRAKVGGEPTPCSPGTEYLVNQQGVIVSREINHTQDLQNAQV